MNYKTRQWLLAVSMVAVTSAAGAVSASVTTLRVMLHPRIAASGTLPATVQAKLAALAGVPLTVTGFTRNGAVEFALATPLEDADARALLARLRNDRGVVWAETPRPAVSTKASNAVVAPNDWGSKFMVRLAPGVAPDWATLAPQFSAAIGAAVVPERQIADVWVLRLLQGQPRATLSAMATALQQLPSVQFAGPVHRVYAQLTPNDPLFAKQWSMTDNVSGIRAEAAWGITTGSPNITVAVVDTGITTHPELAGRVLPGYDFITDPQSARDGDARDGNPQDQGDWNDNGECDGSFAKSSSWHGTFVAGLIAANANDGIGIAGMDWNAQILPVRALGKCGGTTEDVFEALMWAAGVPIDGVPVNMYPARVINMSLGGYGSCEGAVQEAVDIAMSQGAVIVVAAGNQSDNTASYTPSGCAGVITVAASGITGGLSSYSNYGGRVDITAPGGDFDDGDAGEMTSAFNSGTTVPGDPSYGVGSGTSFSAPLVSGTVSLMLARNANLTAGRVQTILQGTTRNFPAGTICSGSSGLCGTGLLDAGVALASTVPASDIVPLGAVPVIEYYRADLDHYFITASPAEINYYDTVLAGLYVRTGGVFFAYPDGATAPIGAVPLCRYAAGGLINSNFLSGDAQECATVGTNRDWVLETSAAFWIELADANGACQDGHIPVYRFFDNRRDANQRHTVDLTERRAMLNRSWVLDARAPNGAVYCSPI